MIKLLDTPTHTAETTGRLPNALENARGWRDGELVRTDKYVSVTDHPSHAAIITYRQALRAWPSDSTFPTIRPVL